MAPTVAKAVSADTYTYRPTGFTFGEDVNAVLLMLLGFIVFYGLIFVLIVFCDLLANPRADEDEIFDCNCDHHGLMSDDALNERMLHRRPHEIFKNDVATQRDDHGRQPSHHYSESSSYLEAVANHQPSWRDRAVG